MITGRRDRDGGGGVREECASGYFPGAVIWCKASTIMNYLIQLKCKNFVFSRASTQRDSLFYELISST